LIEYKCSVNIGKITFEGFVYLMRWTCLIYKKNSDDKWEGKIANFKNETLVVGSMTHNLNWEFFILPLLTWNHCFGCQQFQAWSFDLKHFFKSAQVHHSWIIAKFLWVSLQFFCMNHVVWQFLTGVDDIFLLWLHKQVK
jgi:hypothetical protein